MMVFVFSRKHINSPTILLLEFKLLSQVEALTKCEKFDKYKHIVYDKYWEMFLKIIIKVLKKRLYVIF